MKGLHISNYLVFMLLTCQSSSHAVIIYQLIGCPFA
uniref:Uncharacterized protein n=1 Tax=Rhizophora mucronata TaxID=61149 RepID=A0A2P2IMV8_RHIMU